jgi:hypothetical protein
VVGVIEVVVVVVHITNETSKKGVPEVWVVVVSRTVVEIALIAIVAIFMKVTEAVTEECRLEEVVVEVAILDTPVGTNLHTEGLEVECMRIRLELMNREDTG